MPEGASTHLSPGVWGGRFTSQLTGPSLDGFTAFLAAAGPAPPEPEPEPPPEPPAGLLAPAVAVLPVAAAGEAAPAAGDGESDADGLLEASAQVGGGGVLYKGELVPEDEVPVPCVGEAYEVRGALARARLACQDTRAAWHLQSPRTRQAQQRCGPGVTRPVAGAV
jgi:hypothetical protein